MNKGVDLTQNLPLFVAEYKEIQQIMNTENPEFNLLENEVEKVQNNQYIINCDENGISRFERLLNIIPLPDDTLNSRISRCLTRWNETIPYTFKSLKNKLDIMCGEGNYQLIPNFNDYSLEVIVSLSMSGQTEELENMLSYILPANIVVIARNSMVKNITGAVRGGSATIESKCFTLQSKDNLDRLLSGLATEETATNITRTVN